MFATILSQSFAFLQDAPAPEGNTSVVRIVSGAVAVLLIGLVIMRRKKTAKKEEDEF